MNRSKAGAASVLLGLLTCTAFLAAQPVRPSPQPLDLDALKAGWKKRIKDIGQSGKLPIIDIESSYNASRFDIDDFSAQMDRYGLALIAFSPNIELGMYFRWKMTWSDHSRALVRADPVRYIPTTVGGNYPAWAKEPARVLQETIAHVEAENYPLMGEFFFRHYPSQRQADRDESERDLDIPINGEIGRRLFSFAEKSGIPFEIHYEVEDRLLPPLEEMLKEHPGAKVIWCHLAQVRYARRNTIYGPDYVEKLIEKYANLHFDLAVPGPESVYPLSGDHYSRIWDQSSGRLDARWKQLIIRHPWRFHAALDLGPDRMDALPAKLKRQRKMLDELPSAVREVVAYKASWKLLFNEEL